MAVSQRSVHLRLRVFGAFLSARCGLEAAAGTEEAGTGKAKAGEAGTGNVGRRSGGAGISGSLSSGAFLLFRRDGAGASFLFSGSVRVF